MSSVSFCNKLIEIWNQSGHPSTRSLLTRATFNAVWVSGLTLSSSIWVPLFEFLYLSWVPLKIPLNELITFIISFMSLFLNLKIFPTCIYACAQKLFCWTFAPFLANFDILHSNNFFPILRAGKMRGKGKNPCNCTILDSWVSDNFILANFNIKIYEALKIFYQLIIYVENYSCP